MAQLFIFLAGVWDGKKTGALVRAEDHVFVGDNVIVPNEFSIIHREKTLCAAHCAQVSEQLLKALYREHKRQENLVVESFLNDYYSYSLRKMYSIAISIKECISKNKYSKIFLIAPRTSCDSLPMIGFQTTESKRGSPYLLGAYIAKTLPVMLPGTKFSSIKVKGDIFCNNFIRKLTIKAANAAFTVLLACRIVSLHKPFLITQVKKNIASVVIIRNVHQARSAERLLSKSCNSIAVVFPQATQGNIIGLQECIRKIPSHVPIVGLSMADVFLSYLDSKKDLKKLQSNTIKYSDCSISIDGISIDFNVSWLVKEIMLVGIAVFYKRLLTRLIAKFLPMKLVNFELVGRFAGLEAAAAKELKVEVHSIQTALISSVVHPIFPFSEYFYADGIITKTLIENIGTISNGKVVYEGPAINVLPMRSPKTFSKIAYFTQPYEFEISIDIMSALGVWARSRGASIKLKLHPRDEVSDYTQFLEENADVYYLHDSAEIEFLIRDVDVTITRTSSVAKEALALGCPIVLCQWSLFDRSIVADYIVENISHAYCSKTRDELFQMLDLASDTAEYSRVISSLLFGEKTISDLVAASTGP